MRLKASPLRSSVLSPVTTSPAHREPIGQGRGWLRENTLACSCPGIFRRISRPTRKQGGNGRLQRRRCTLCCCSFPHSITFLRRKNFYVILLIGEIFCSVIIREISGVDKSTHNRSCVLFSLIQLFSCTEKIFVLYCQSGKCFTLLLLGRFWREGLEPLIILLLFLPLFNRFLASKKFLCYTINRRSVFYPIIREILTQR